MNLHAQRNVLSPSILSDSTTLAEPLTSQSPSLRSKSLVTTAGENDAYADSIKEAWERAKAEVESRCTSKQRQIIAGTVTADDVLARLNALGDRQKSRLSVRWAQKLKPFLESIQLYDGALKTYCNSGVRELALVWGTISLIIDIAGRFVGCFERFLDVLSLLGENLPRINEYTALFANHARIQNVLSLIYVDLLDFCVLAITFFKRRGISILWRVLWSDLEGRTNLIVERIIRHKTLADVEANAAAIMEAKLGREETVVQQAAFKLREIVKWLAPADTDGSLEILTRSKLPGTCDWFERADLIQSWVSDKTRVLWIRGIPGCGKSTMCSSLIESLKSEELVDRDGPVTIFFFCDGNSPTKRSSLAMIRSLIAQLLSRCVECIDPVFDCMLQSGQERASSLQQLTQLMTTMLSCQSHRRIRIIVDAWDECEDGKTSSLLDDFLAWSALDKSHVQLLLSSRNEPHIRSNLESFPTMEITPDLIESDLDCYVQAALGQPPLSKLSNSALRSKIITELRESAGGQFLWVRLMIESLRKATHLYNLEDIISSLPRGLERAYGRVLENLLLEPLWRQETAHRLFMLLAHSERLLTVTELDAALSIRDGTTSPGAFDQLLDFNVFLDEVCGSLVQVASSSPNGEPTVSFVHVTVKQFLSAPNDVWDTQTEKGIMKFRVQEQPSHEVLARICIDQMSYKKLGERSQAGVGKEELYAIYPFLSYASTHWATHLTKAGPPTPTKLMGILEFLRSPNLGLYLQRSASEKTSSQDLTVLQSQINTWISSSKIGGVEVTGVRDCFATQFRRMIADCKEQLGIAHPQTLEVMHQFATLLHYDGKWTEAEPLYREVLEERTSLFGAESLITLETAFELAIVLRRLGDTEESRQLQEKVLEARLDILSDNDLATLLARDELAQCLKELKLLDESIELSRKNLKAMQELFGENDARTLRIVNNLASILKDLGIRYQAEGNDEAAHDAFNECEVLSLRCLDGRGAIYGPEHPETLTVTNMLGITCMLLGKLGESERWHQRTLSGREKIFGVHNTHTQRSMRNLVRLLLAQFKTVEAAEMQAKLRASLAVNGSLLRRSSWTSWKSAKSS